MASTTVRKQQLERAKKRITKRSEIIGLQQKKGEIEHKLRAARAELKQL